MIRPYSLELYLWGFLRSYLKVCSSSGSVIVCIRHLEKLLKLNFRLSVFLIKQTYVCMRAYGKTFSGEYLNLQILL